MKQMRLILLVFFFYTSVGFAQIADKQVQVISYLEALQNTADSLLKNTPRKESGESYFNISDVLYAKARQITTQEVFRQRDMANSGFMVTMQQLLKKLQADLYKDKPALANLDIPDNLGITVKAALTNFFRIQPPLGLEQDQRYAWVMIQVFENLDQISVGLLQERLTAELRKSILQRLVVQQNIISRLKQYQKTN
ncbi:hypothetical protein [Mucilaginibacter agri]|uniref:Uncharacterized protein n=1 Tax=Mucilaginibacter agri TaxID=2695265 RepID=A0A966DSB4_9SPHI|nr:hypothetical protein [Mucilaginibacter agri]NCD68062.1 hypothetical protein [Mucilaginibacter agri]